jgi:hypothetical protein
MGLGVQGCCGKGIGFDRREWPGQADKGEAVVEDLAETIRAEV